MSDTIFALATPPGRGGIAVIRLSGPAALSLLPRLGVSSWTARVARRARLRHRGRTLDDGLVLVFPAPASFTGEDVVEFHIHGGKAVCDAVATALQAEGLRLAEPGEFSRRAFENGKMDLLAAEGLADLVAAETEAQRVQALDQAGGNLSALYEGWRDRLIHAMAHLEATIDFADEDIPPDLLVGVDRAIADLIGDMTGHLEDSHRGERLRDGIRVAILGAPNSGKSSLLNRLARRDAAIVSARAGTTRDVVEVHLDLGGYPVILADTAGIRDDVDEIEAEGIRRSHAAASAADLVLEVVDCLDPRRVAVQAPRERIMVLYNKCDLASGINFDDGLPISARTGEGLDVLTDRMVGWLRDLYTARQSPPLTRSRHRALVEESVSALRLAAGAVDIVLKAEDLRLAARSLGRITGAVDVEDMLDVIFRDFCIGK